jgi:glycosyltransferase involved in cell wall biosynthesis
MACHADLELLSTPHHQPERAKIFSRSRPRTKHLMNILHVESSPNWGGQEFRTQIEIQWLRAHGHGAWIMCDPRGKPFAHAVESTLQPAPLVFRKRSFIPNIFRVWQFCRRHKVDLIKTHSSRDSWLSWPLFVLGHIVVRSCNIERHITKASRAFIYRHGCTGIIATAETIRNSLVDVTRVGAKKIAIVGEGIDLAKFNPSVSGKKFRAELSVDAAASLIGMVAMLRTEKGVLDFVDCAAKILASVPNARFVIAGEGPKRRLVEERIKKNFPAAAASPVFLAGYRTDTPEVLAALDVVVIPSHSEARCRVLAEAMATGKPVVATRVGGIPEVLRHDVSGLLVPAHEPAALAAAVEKLLADAPLRERLAAAGLATAQSELSLDAVMERTLEVYRQFLKS